MPAIFCYTSHLINKKYEVAPTCDSCVDEKSNIMVELNVSMFNILLSYYGLLTKGLFSYSVVWVGIVSKPVGEGIIPSQTTL